MRSLLLATLGIFVVGCADKEAADPGEVVRRETVTRIAPSSHDTARTVRVGCDDDGLHITAPPGSRVTVPDDATHDAEAQVVLPYDGEGRPIRVTKSLGFIGDNPLTQSSSRGGPWNVPDALLPQHTHHQQSYGTRYHGGGHSYSYSPGYVPSHSAPRPM